MPASAVLLAAYNYLSNRVLAPSAYVPANTAMSGVLVGLGRVAGLSWDEMGLGRDRLREGLTWGLGTAAFVAGGVAALATIPPARSLFADRRVAGFSGSEAAHEMLIRIPIGTALFEEVAFRGVLLGLLCRSDRALGAVADTSGLFGLWHILPTLDALDRSPAMDAIERLVGTGTAVTVAMAVTAAAGMAFSWLRLRSGSLLAPIMAHTATNSLSFLAAYIMQRTSVSSGLGPASQLSVSGSTAGTAPPR